MEAKIRRPKYNDETKYFLYCVCAMWYIPTSFLIYELFCFKIEFLLKSLLANLHFCIKINFQSCKKRFLDYVKCL